MTSFPRVALIYPPVTDPTSGYHSLSYIDSYARSRGFPPADIFDTNIEAFHYTISPPGVTWLEHCIRTASALPAGDPLPERVLRRRSLSADTGNPSAARAAVRVLQDPELFYDYPKYCRAVDDVSAWMAYAGMAGYPGQFSRGFQLAATPGVAAGSVAALTDHDVLARYSRPFQAYYEDVLIPSLCRGAYGVIGISITYSFQLPFALWLLHLIRAALPDVFLVAGGTEVSDTWKYARDKADVFRIFDAADAVVTGEGETAYTAILGAVRDGTLPAGHPNIRLHSRYGLSRQLLSTHYEALSELPTPDFSTLPWPLYLSPEPFVYYSPARGCYWNKCTFCDYGLNGDSPTSPWRQEKIEAMVRDVIEISKLARFIYFSVDVLAPAMLVKFAEHVVAARLDIRWGAEIRLEKYWSDEKCALLRDSGCVAVSVGFESGNQRILDLIDKGTRPHDIKQTITAMTRAGIAVQMMGFTGFPTETAEEALDSINFLASNRSQWTFGGLGQFVLTPGAIAARQSERFAISNIRPRPGADIARILDFDEPISQQAASRVTDAKARLGPTYHERPWLGGVDCPHTFFYHDRHGPSVLSALRQALLHQNPNEPSAFVANGIFVQADDSTTTQDSAPPNTDLCTRSRGVLFRRADGTLFPLAPAMQAFIELFTAPVVVRDAAHGAQLDQGIAMRLWETAVQRGLLRRVPGL